MFRKRHESTCLKVHEISLTRNSTGPMYTRMHFIINLYCPSANYLTNLIQRGAGREETLTEAMHPRSRDEFVRKIHFARHASPLIAPRLKGREAEMDYPEGEKSAFAPPRVGREIFRDIFRKLSIYFTLFIYATTCDVSRTRLIRRWQIFFPRFWSMILSCN